MLHRIATTLLLISIASSTSADSLRVRSLKQLKGKGNNPNGPNDLFENDSDVGIECDVHLAMHSPPPDRGQGQGRHDDPEDDAETAEDLLHGICEDGHIYELQGLDEAERERVTTEVTDDGGRGPRKRYAFPGATKNKGKGPNKSNILNVPARGPGKKHQAINTASEKSAANSRRRNRKLAIRQQGISTVLLLRVKALDAETTCVHQDCAAHTFGGYNTAGEFDDLNLVTRTRDCSYSKLQFNPPPDGNGDIATYPGLINGTATIELNETVIGVHHGTVLDWALSAAPPVVGSLDQYDHVMVFMPPGVAMGGGAAWGYVGWKYTWYHDGYKLMTGVQMHELGHNIGLSHSGESGAGYGDGSCYMGYGGGDVKMCYNAPKSHWLGWYEEYHQYLDPYETPSKLVQLVGLADYDEAMVSGDPSSQAIVLKIDMYESQNLYLTYNRAEKVNAEVQEFQDMITITRSNGPGQSWVETGLIPGQKYSVEFISGSGMVLEITACDRDTGTPDTSAVSIHVVGIGEPTCIPPASIPFVSSWELTYAGDLTDSLVGYYTFDDDLLDSSGSGYHGSIGGGSLSYVDGPVGRALSLDGIDDFVALPNVGDFNFGVGDFTLTFWYRVSGDQSGSPAIITNKDWTSGLNPGWLVSSSYGPGSNGDDLSINLSDGTTQANANQATDVAFNTWHFVVIRIERGEKMSLLRSYGKNYQLQEDAIEVTGSLDTGLPILIGGSHVHEGKTKMDMDDLGIWRRSLSSEEVEAIFIAGRDHGKQLITSMEPLTNEKVPMPNTLIANYELESDIKDSSSNNLDLVLEDGGGVSYESSASGSHLTLDNINPPAKSFATVPDTSLLDFDSVDFTISFWSRTSAPLSGIDPSIVSNKNWNSGSNPGFTVGVGTNGRLEYNSGDGSSRCDYDGQGGTMTDGQWHFVALTQTQGAAGQVALYLDGKKVAQKSCVLNTLSSGFPIKIGGSWEYYAHYSGNVDKVMIYNSALSHANVFDLYTKGRDLTLTYSPTASNYPTHSPTLRPTQEPSPFPTKFPTSSPLSCEGVYDDVLCCGSDSIKQADYRGSISQTEGGIDCQDWTSQSPHGHSRTPGSYPNSGLESNNCRNPDGEPRAWCYTADPNVRWDYCTVPSCGTISTPPPTPAPITPAPTTSKPTTDTPTTEEPSPSPTDEPSPSPSKNPTDVPTPAPSDSPSKLPTPKPSLSPSAGPTDMPTLVPSDSPSNSPTPKPSLSPSKSPSVSPTFKPTESPTPQPTPDPTPQPTDAPTPKPTRLPTNLPTDNPTPLPTNAPTPNPSPSPTETAVCSGMDTSCCGSFWFGKRQNDYRGTISKTVGGIECQAWASQSPHGHNLTPQNYPNSGLDSNYCRNPDGEPRAWCYTSESSKRWDYCDVPACESACAAGDADQCGCAEVKQADYRGTISTTISGKTCQAWSSQSPHSHTRTPENNPNSGLDSNYCRNPDGEPQAWCYTVEAGKRWEYCDVPVCGQ